MRRWVIGWWALLSLFSTGCFITPREGDISVELGAERVDVVVQLRDVRLVPHDVLDGLRVFVPYADLESARGLFAKSPMAKWGGTLTSVTWRARDRTLDVEVRGTLPRSAFETCARAACGGGPAPTEDRCEGFPIRRCGAGGILTPDAPRLDTHEVRAPEQWPAEAKRLEARLVYVKQDELKPALEVFSSYSRAPVAARASLQQVDAFKQAYDGGDLSRASSLYEHARTTANPLVLEGVQRERMRLLHRFLDSHRAVLLSLPPGLDSFVGFQPDDREPPLAPMPELLRLRLQIAYEAALRDYRGPRGRVTPADLVLGEVCADAHIQRNKASRRFCDQLMLRGPKGWTFASELTPARSGG
ncbi:hypothetical protein HPC49_28630 [Pyxidicoccus fallax]|uniref:Lipoprotein n=1 Tax=Pyxidicoccus fallax TaxID=394095 RepID=A0A848LT73_9BACT|nr:hypothetical protein [Pyxidicoccus fallax]NMO21167.1 hypothetical protein [Pyxidicoccus fallax]NPC82171.1 hypothetical protein [Pyxidicoccus fallax]